MSGFSQRFFILSRFVHYFFSAKSPNAIHSPFVFELYTQVIRNKNVFYKYRTVESLRASLLMNHRELDTIELGAGSEVLSSKKKKISSMARHYAKSPKYGQVLFRLINFFQPKNIIELGTSLGISSLYLALPDTNAKLITHEGCPQTAAEAENNFRALKAKNIEVVKGNFDDTLLLSLNKIKSVDFIFVDGNHRKEPTLRYFRWCLDFANEQSIFVFDDIHWSPEMEEAWEEIKNHSRVTTTIDLFFIGLVFFRKELSRDHFVLRF